jgi:hypothetical protein
MLIGFSNPFSVMAGGKSKRLAGLGDYASCNAACQANYDATSDAFYNCNDACVNADSAAANSGSSSTGSSGSPQNNQSSWWSTALTSLVKGAASGLVSPQGACPPGSSGQYPLCTCMPGSPGTYPNCLTAPSFFSTGTGILTLVGGAGLLFYLLKKKK